MNLSRWYLRLSVIYIVLGVTLGNVMGATGDHSLHPVHAHINLLGWVGMSIFAFFYRAFPAAAMGKLARVQFWIYVPGTVVQMVTLTLLIRGNAEMEKILGPASMLVGVTFLLFAIQVWQQTASAD